MHTNGPLLALTGRVPNADHAVRYRSRGWLKNALLSVSPALLQACAGGGSSTSTSTVGDATGRVIKGPVAGAKVFADVDEDGFHDDGEPFTITNHEGRFSLARDTAAERAAPLVTLGGWDPVSGASFDGISLLAPSDATVITPLTSLIHAGISETVLLSAIQIGGGTAVDLKSFDHHTSLASDNEELSVTGKAVENASQQLLSTFKLLIDVQKASHSNNVNVVDVVRSVASALGDANLGSGASDLNALLSDSQVLSAATEVVLLATIRDSEGVDRTSTVSNDAATGIATNVAGSLKDVNEKLSDGAADPLNASTVAILEGVLSAEVSASVASAVSNSTTLAINVAPVVGNVVLSQGGLTVTKALEDGALSAALTSLSKDGSDYSIPDETTPTWKWQELVSDSNNGQAWSDIEGAQANSFTPAQALVGKDIRVVASFTVGDHIERIFGVATKVENVNDIPTGAKFAGSAREDETLSVNLDEFSDEDGVSNAEYSYLWERLTSSDAASGETVGSGDASYTLTQGDVGDYIRVTISYTDDLGGQNRAVIVSSQISNVNDAPTGSVAVSSSGEYAEDQTLTAGVGTLADQDGLGTVSFVWQRRSGDDGTQWSDVGTGSTYLLADDDVGTILRVSGSYVDDEGTTETVVSNATSEIQNINDLPTGKPVLVGTANTNSTLTANVDDLRDDDGLTQPQYAYEWQRRESDQDQWQVILGASNASYSPAGVDAGFFIRVLVSFTDDHGTPEQVVSGSSSEVTSNSPASGTVTITGNATADEGVAFTATPSAFTDSDGFADVDDNDVPDTLNWQWYKRINASSDWTKISGADGTTFTPNDAEVGFMLAVTAAFVDTLGTIETIWSSTTAAITNVDDPTTGSVLIDFTRNVENETLSLAASRVDIADEDGINDAGWLWESRANDGDWEAIDNATDTISISSFDAVTHYRASRTWTDDYGNAGSLAANKVSVGTTGADSISSGDTSSIIVGLSGNDTLSGGAGSDLVLGGEHDDDLSGGGGKDVFRYDIESGSTLASSLNQWVGRDGKDTISDFKLGVDVLQFVDMDAGSGDNPDPVSTYTEFVQGYGSKFKAVTSGQDVVFIFAPSGDTDGGSVTGNSQLTLSGLNSDANNPVSLTSSADFMNLFPESTFDFGI